MKEKIAILLATYNSSKFLREQLDSLQNQSCKDFHIYVRDDGSTDDTIEILKEYLNITILDDTNKHKGAMRSFMWLLESVEADYYMFCDHDDVWNHDKVELTVNRMIEAERENKGMPIVVNTDLEVVDQNLNTIHPSMWRYDKIDPRILSDYNHLAVCNVFTGCTMMINQIAKELSLPISPNATMHDHWIALKVANAGGVLTYVDSATIKYRQHGNNVVGSHGIGKNYLLNKIISLEKTIQSNRETLAMLSDIKKVSIISYLYYKLLYYFKRQYQKTETIYKG